VVCPDRSQPSFHHHATGTHGITLVAGLAAIAAAVVVQGTGRAGLGACVAAAGGIAIGLGAALSALPYIAYPGVPLPCSGAGVPLGAYLGATAIGGPLLITALVLLYASVHMQAGQCPGRAGPPLPGSRRRRGRPAGPARARAARRPARRG
jgi:hypothetical protein